MVTMCTTTTSIAHGVGAISIDERRMDIYGKLEGLIFRFMYSELRVIKFVPLHAQAS